MRVARKRLLLKKGVYELLLSDGQKLWADQKDGEIEEDEEINEQRLAELKERSNHLRARDAGLRFLAASELFRGELRRKLISKGFSSNVIESVLQELSRSKYQDDERAARSLVNSRLSRGGIGKARLAALLKERGYPKEKADTLLAEMVPRCYEKDELDKFAKRKRATFRKELEKELARELKKDEPAEMVDATEGERQSSTRRSRSAIWVRVRRKVRDKIIRRLVSAGFSFDDARETANRITSDYDPDSYEASEVE